MSDRSRDLSDIEAEITQFTGEYARFQKSLYRARTFVLLPLFLGALLTAALVAGSLYVSSRLHETSGATAALATRLEGLDPNTITDLRHQLSTALALREEMEKSVAGLRSGAQAVPELQASVARLETSLRDLDTLVRREKTCPPGFLSVESRGEQLGCIEKKQQGNGQFNVLDANATCFREWGGRLPFVTELHAATILGAPLERPKPRDVTGNAYYNDESIGPAEGDNAFMVYSADPARPLGVCRAGVCGQQGDTGFRCWIPR